MNSYFKPSNFEPLHGGHNTEFQDTEAQKSERSIGEIISEANSLSPEQIEHILAYQRENGVRFGEAAVALGLANTDDVLWALAQQFHYPYTSEARGTLDPELVVATRPFTEEAEAFRAIRSHLIMKLYSEDGPRAALAILSPNSGDGKSYFAANLAAAFAQLPGRTLLIDADLRNPRQHDIFKLENQTGGLAAILSGRAATKAIRSVKDLPNLFVLPAGTTPPNPLELLERPALGLMLKELKTKFDRIIVDTPAAIHGTDGAVTAAKCGAALIVARQNRTRIPSIQQLVRTVSLGPTKLIGSIFNEF
jgi:chain length determinant protein tyrosine kinase EpsG